MTIPAIPPSVGANKAIAAMVGGAVSTIVMLVLNRYMAPPPFPAEFGQSVQTLATALLVYYVPHGGNT